jgi:DNA-binding CsgD family transcriptional regulator/DNA-binding MarR family transcriptional regulator
MTDALDGAVSGTGTVVLVEGEAGIGKTRLLGELASLAGTLDVTVRRGAAEELEQGRPFGSLIDALGIPDTAPMLSSGSAARAADARFLAQDAFVDHVDRLAADGPLLLVVDDVHWADRASLATLWALARRRADLRLLLVLAFRPTPQSADLARVIQGCTTAGVPHLRLGPIDDAAIAELATDVVGGAAGPGLLRELGGARGNPFFAIELLQALDREEGLVERDGVLEVEHVGLPPSLRDTLVRRLATLSERASTALSVAAVLGGTGRVGDIAALLGVSTADAGAAITEAERAGLVEPSGDVVAFRHDLIRQALYENLPEAVRTAWHREAAQGLDGRAEPAIVARHLALGAEPGDADAVDMLRRTALTLAGAEPEAALGLLDRALELSTADQRVELEVTRAETLLESGRAEDAGSQAAAVLKHSAPVPLRARAHVALAEARSHQGRLVEAVEHFTAAIETNALDERAAASALGRLAENRLWTFALDQAMDEADRAYEAGARLGIRSLMVEALATRCGVHEFRAELDAAIADGGEAVRLAEEDPDSVRRTPHAYLGLTFIAADRLEEARRVAEEGRRRSSELGQLLVLPNYQALLVRIAWFDGRWDDALSDADLAVSVAEDFGLRFGVAANEGVRGLIALHRGNVEAARRCVEQHRIARRGGNDDASGSELLVLLGAQLHEADGDVGAAAATLWSLFEVERELGMDAARIWPGPACVRLLLAAGRAEDAHTVADDLAAIGTKADTPSARGASLHARGLIERDPPALLAAAAEFERARRPLDQAEALEGAAVLQAAAGDRDLALESFNAALAITDQLGATYDSRRIGAALRELGVRTASKERRRRAISGWDSLTDAERDVARLVGEGLRNAEIAERLFVSRRTVESHVSRLYAKLGAENRVVLAKVIDEHAPARAI